MKKIFMSSISSNMLKTIALCAMVIDHIGYYFEPFLPLLLFKTLRIIGRIAMPIFTYLLVQGFFHTKDFKKYLKRIVICAIVTQFVITSGMLINFKFFTNYVTTIYKNGNILFTFTLCLILMKILYENTLIKKWDYNKNMSLKIILAIIIFAISALVPIDYGVETVTLSLLMYYIEKLKLTVMIQRGRAATNAYGLLAKGISEKKIQIIYMLLIVFAIGIIAVYYTSNFYLLLAAIPIALYSGEKGKSSKFTKYFFYVVFPVHHILLYLGAMSLMFT